VSTADQADEIVGAAVARPVEYRYPIEFPEYGPHDTAEEAAALKGDFGACWSVWHTNRWIASSKVLFNWSYEAETAAGLRVQLDRLMAAAIPELRARLAEAEAAAGRLRERARVPSSI
jgi:hypothetical protein